VPFLNETTGRIFCFFFPFRMGDFGSFFEAFFFFRAMKISPVFSFLVGSVFASRLFFWLDFFFIPSSPVIFLYISGAGYPVSRWVFLLRASPKLLFFFHCAVFPLQVRWFLWRCSLLFRPPLFPPFCVGFSRYPRPENPPTRNSAKKSGDFYNRTWEPPQDKFRRSGSLNPWATCAYDLFPITHAVASPQIILRNF